MKSNLSIIFFYGLFLSVLSKNLLPSPRSCCLFLKPHSFSFVIRSVELIFVKGIKLVLFLVYRCPFIWTSFVEKTTLCLLKFNLCQEWVLHSCVIFFLDSLLSFINLCVYPLSIPYCLVYWSFIVRLKLSSVCSLAFSPP